MPPKPITPWDAAARFIQDLTVADLVWLVIAGVLVGALYWLSTKQIKRETGTTSDVLLWFAMLAGWLFCLVTFGYPRIYVGGLSALVAGTTVALVCFTIVAFILRGDSEWMQIVYGVVVIMVGFSVAITFAIGAQSFSYSLIFGFFFGILSGMFVRSIRRIIGKQNAVEEEEMVGARTDGWDFGKSKKI